MAREGPWFEAIAIGNLNFVAKVKSEFGLKASRREVIERAVHMRSARKLTVQLTGRNEVLSSKTSRFGERNPELTAT